YPRQQDAAEEEDERPRAAKRSDLIRDLLPDGHLLVHLDVDVARDALRDEFVGLTQTPPDLLNHHERRLRVREQEFVHAFLAQAAEDGLRVGAGAGGTLAAVEHGQLAEKVVGAETG